jgi:hypothetical protein
MTRMPDGNTAAEREYDGGGDHDRCDHCGLGGMPLQDYRNELWCGACITLEERACSHQWVDPKAEPNDRHPVVPIIGAGPNMMRKGKTYRCQQCGREVNV